MSVIEGIHARQVFDSRARPTVEAEVRLTGGVRARASVPSGASTGAHEATELRDRDEAFFGGLGVLSAVEHVCGEIAAALTGREVADQAGCDAVLRELDGTRGLSRLGANAVLATSLAVCRASAQLAWQPLFRRIAELAGITEPMLPMPMVNILSGGLHARHGMDVQDFLAIPIAATSMLDAIHLVWRVREATTTVCAERGMPTLLADEGGLSPGCRTGREALELLMTAIERAGLDPGRDVGIAIDVAAASLYDRATGTYHLVREGRHAGTQEMIEMIVSWVDDFPILSVEDPLDEDDWAGWQAITQRLGGRVRLIGDDLFTTDLERLRRGIGSGCATGVLVKLNQNGTLTGTLEVVAAAREANYVPVISARSGETEDDLLADLAVGTSAGQIKVGSVRCSERLSKYNQLIRIAEDPSIPYIARSPCPQPWSGALSERDPRGAVKAFLRHHGLLGPGEQVTMTPLTGGVSSDLWKVDLPAGAVCVKGALAQLKVAQAWFAPVSRNQIEYRWLEWAHALRPGQVPRVLAHDEDAGLFAMEYLPPASYPVWKALLLDGHVDVAVARAVGDVVGQLHSASAADRDSSVRFATDENFEALRIGPYLRVTTRAHPDLEERFLALAKRTAATHLAVVHGDVSPKNILLGAAGPVLIDAECAWFGDPAFDVAFCVNHLLIKSVKLPRCSEALHAAAHALAEAHAARVDWEPPPALAQRAVLLLPALALARVDGSSPVEYLDEAEREIVRRIGRELLGTPPATLDELCERWAGMAHARAVSASPAARRQR